MSASLSKVSTVEALTAYAGTDLDDLCEATRAAIEDGGGFGWIKPPPRHILENYWKGIQLVTVRYLYVIRVEGTIVGSAQLVRPPRNSEAQSFAAQIMSAFLAPWARGHGLGRRLLDAVEKGAREAGFEVLNLDVRETQLPAIKLFEKAGYQRWGTHPAYAKVEDKTIAGHFYWKALGAPQS